MVPETVRGSEPLVQETARKTSAGITGKRNVLRTGAKIATRQRHSRRDQLLQNVCPKDQPQRVGMSDRAACFHALSFGHVAATGLGGKVALHRRPAAEEQRRDE